MADNGAAGLSDPRQAVSYLEEISPEMRGCAILDREGEVLACTGEGEAWKAASSEIFGAADGAGGEPATQAHVATGDGEVFCVRQGDMAAVAATDRFVLASLMLFDMRAVLRELQAS